MGIVLAWAVIISATSRNPWFDVFRYALSDLGGPRAIDPWIYNYGLILVGAITCIYSLYLARVASNKAAVYASAFMLIAGIFLALIGMFPSDTKPHIFISTWFFVQMWLALLASAIDAMIAEDLARGAMLLVLGIAGPAGAALIDKLVGWPSVALLEIYGVIIDAYVVLLTKKY